MGFCLYLLECMSDNGLWQYVVEGGFSPLRRAETIISYQYINILLQ